MMNNKDSNDEIILVVREVAKIVSSLAGIQLGAKQFPMVESRLKSRMVKIGIKSPQEYLRYLKQHLENESQALLSVLTTHHTYFFREFSHFEFLLNNCLETFINNARKRGDKTIHIWSAACSRGNEVYSLAMFFSFHLKQMAPDVFFHIWGTDVDPESVQIAQNGVYKSSELKQSPAMYIADHWIQGSGSVSGFSKIKNELANHCSFTTVNLMNIGTFAKNKTFDLIFCRNVFIYFDQQQIKQIANDFLKILHPDGNLILGVSESLNGLGVDLQLVGPSAYQRKKQTSPQQIQNLNVKIRTEPIRVLCVDDSKTILALLGKILNSENGFQIVGTASNGIEALEFLKNKSVDLITLDLHMPELDGVGFLKKHDDRKIPVLVLSSINREDKTIAQNAIKLGASDYVEKPSLENLAQAGNEIRSKIKTILRNRENIPTKNRSPKEKYEASKNFESSTDGKKIKVLIVDDSETIRNLMKKILSEDADFEVVGLVDRPSLVEEAIKNKRPDVITLDINMPEMDGVRLLEQIHPKYRIPTVMISSISMDEGPLVLKALEIGAVDYIQKPQMNSLREASILIRERLKIAAVAKLRRKFQVRKNVSNKSYDHQSIVFIGSSTGGTEALRVILESMPKQIPPMVIVQHIPPVFSAAFANRLNELCDFDVMEAKDGMEVKPNQVLIAPGGKQLGLKGYGEKVVVRINDEPPMNRHKPSVDYMFKSAAQLQLTKSVAVVLTGMGADGADQLLSLKKIGAKTIAQDEATSTVYGMPKEAIARGGVDYILPLDQIAEKILDLVDQQKLNKESKKSA